MIYKSYLAEQNIEKIDKNIVLFYGENLGQKIDFKANLKKLNKTNELLNFNQEEILRDKNLLVKEIINVSLFEKKKTIFIEQVNDRLIKVLEEVFDLIDDQKIYLFAETLDKKSKIRNLFEKTDKFYAIACYEDNEITIRKIILKRLSGFKGLSDYNVNLIISSCNLNRAKLKNELDKIEIFFLDKNLDSSKLESLLDINVTEDFDNLKDFALSGDKTNTNKLLGKTILDDDKIFLYLSNINHRLNTLLEVISTKEKNLEKAIDTIKPAIFWKDKPKFIMQLKKWDTNKIRKIFKRTYYIEKGAKSGAGITKNLLIKKLIIDICETANV